MIETSNETIISSQEIARTTSKISSVVSSQANETCDGACRIEDLSKTMIALVK